MPVRDTQNWAAQQLFSLPKTSFPDIDRQEMAVLAIIALLISVIIVACLIFKRMRSGSPRKSRRPGEYQAKRILTNNETEFYSRMLRALPDFTILSQVSMSALIEPRTTVPGEYMGKRARFSQKYVDFVICQPNKLDVICIVELDDITHDPEKDAKRDEMLEGAGYTVVRWHSRRKPSVSEIASTIKKIAKQAA